MTENEIKMVSPYLVSLQMSEDRQTTPLSSHLFHKKKLWKIYLLSIDPYIITFVARQCLVISDYFRLSGFNNGINWLPTHFEHYFINWVRIDYALLMCVDDIVVTSKLIPIRLSKLFVVDENSSWNVFLLISFSNE